MGIIKINILYMVYKRNDHIGVIESLFNGLKVKRRLLPSLTHPISKLSQQGYF